MSKIKFAELTIHQLHRLDSDDPDLHSALNFTPPICSHDVSELKKLYSFYKELDEKRIIAFNKIINKIKNSKSNWHLINDEAYALREEYARLVAHCNVVFDYYYLMVSSYNKN